MAAEDLNDTAVIQDDNSQTENNEKINLNSNEIKTNNTISSSDEDTLGDDDTDVKVVIRDSNYPNNSSITQNAIYSPSLEYYVVYPTSGTVLQADLIIKNGDDGIITIDSPDGETWTEINNLNLKFNETGQYTLNAELKIVMFMSETPSYDISSNSITYDVTITNESQETETTTTNNASIVIYDINYPSQSTIYSTGDYVADIAYTITKSGDGFSDEALEVFINSESVGSTTPNTSNRLGNLTFNEDNTWILSVVYSATVNGTKINTTSNALTFITINTSGGETNTTDDNSSDVKVLIRDSNYPDNSTITLNNVYTPSLEYYVVYPTSGTILQTDLIIKNDDEGLITIDDPADKTWTKIDNLDLILNETGQYTLNAELLITMFMSDTSAYDVSSNNIIYKMTVSNESEETVTPLLSVSVADVVYPNMATAVISSNVDGVYILNVYNTDYEVTVSNGAGSKSFSIGVGTFTATVSSKTNSSLKNSTSFTVSQNQNTSAATITASDLTRALKSPYDFKATFYDKNGNLLKNATVNFIINGNDHIVYTDEYGVAKLVNVLSTGTYNVCISNIATAESLNKTVKIVNRITGNKNIKADYSYQFTYKVRLFADNGQAVGAGESATVTINKVKYKVVSDKNGYITVKIKNNKLTPKTYKITAVYKGVSVSSNVAVKQILKSKNVAVKKSKKVKKFSATLKTSKGKAIKGKKITFKIKNKSYSAKTNKKGVATVKIAKNLKVGKYKVTIKYLNNSIKKTLKIKK